MVGECDTEYKLASTFLFNKVPLIDYYRYLLTLTERMLSLSKWVTGIEKEREWLHGNIKKAISNLRFLHYDGPSDDSDSGEEAKRECIMDHLAWVTQY